MAVSPPIITSLKVETGGKMGRQKLKPGHVIEIATPVGYAYAQCTHEHPMFGHLLRVLPGLYQDPLKTFKEVVESHERYFIFFLWESSTDQGIVRIVAKERVPEGSKAFPLFKAGATNPATRRVETWWLWDGKSAWKVGALTPEQRGLPVREIWNDIMLAEMITKGWSPADEA